MNPFMISLSLATTLLMGISFNSGGAEAREVKVKSGKEAIIYGLRPRDCNAKNPPTVAWFESNYDQAVTTKPKNGRVYAVAKTRMGRSRRCGHNVPQRGVVYRSNKGFTGTDTICFFANDCIKVSVR